jgi:hypothetical protein
VLFLRQSKVSRFSPGVLLRLPLSLFLLYLCRFVIVISAADQVCAHHAHHAHRASFCYPSFECSHRKRGANAIENRRSICTMVSLSRILLCRLPSYLRDGSRYILALCLFIILLSSSPPLPISADVCESTLLIDVAAYRLEATISKPLARHRLEIISFAALPRNSESTPSTDQISSLITRNSTRRIV